MGEIASGSLFDHDADSVDLFVMAAIPAFNEEKTIGSLVLGARKYANEVVVVDDGSTDGTAWIAQQAGARVIRHAGNRGYGAAIRSCLSAARENGTGVLVILDGDGQHRPEEIPRVVEPIAKGLADVCIGSRFLESGATRKIPRYRRVGIRLLTYLTNIGTRNNGHLKDAQSGFRAYSRPAIDSIDPQEAGMGASAEILWDADKKGLRIVEVPVTVDYDVGGSRQGPFRHGLSVIGSMIRYAESEHPLSFFGVPGLIMFVGGVAIGAYAFLGIVGKATPEFAMLFATMTLTFLGLLLGFTGLILHAVISASRRSR